MKGHGTSHSTRGALRRTAVSSPAAAGIGLLNKQRVIRSVRTRAMSRDRSLIVPALFFLLILSVLAFTWTRVHVIHLGYEIYVASNEREAAMLFHHELTVEKATLSSAQRLERRANERLNMHAPGNHQVVIMR